jgi:hypothetical protein
LFSFDPCLLVEPKRWPALRVANSAFLKASFCGVLGLEWPWSWRRGRRSRARAAVADSARPNRHPAMPFLQDFHVNQRSTTTRGAPHDARDRTSRPVERPESIFAGESQHCQAHEGFAQDDCTAVGRLRACRGRYGGNLGGSATSAERRLWEPLRSVQTLRAPMWETCDPQRQQDRSKTHRSGGHP